MKTITLSLLIMVATVCCTPQAKPTGITLRQLTFKSIFASYKKDSTQVYCLLGRGFFRTPSSANADSFKAAWLTQHPDAQVISVSATGRTAPAKQKESLIYCWLVDKGDTINTYLVRNGCYPAGTMMKLATKDEMSRADRDIMEPGEYSVSYIDKKAWDAFVEQLKAADAYAQSQKLGLWSKEATE